MGSRGGEIQRRSYTEPDGNESPDNSSSRLWASCGNRYKQGAGLGAADIISGRFQ